MVSEHAATMQLINPKLKSFYQCHWCDSWRTMFIQEEGSSADIPMWSWWCIDCDRRTSIEEMYFHKFGEYPVYTTIQPRSEESDRRLEISRMVQKILKEWGMEK